jgi:hypothetical protein
MESEKLISKPRRAEPPKKKNISNKIKPMYSSERNAAALLGERSNEKILEPSSGGIGNKLRIARSRFH